jgi:hypothetical protein
MNENNSDRKKIAKKATVNNSPLGAPTTNRGGLYPSPDSPVLQQDDAGW